MYFESYPTLNIIHMATTIQIFVKNVSENPNSFKVSDRDLSDVVVRKRSGSETLVLMVLRPETQRAGRYLKKSMVLMYKYWIFRFYYYNHMSGSVFAL